VKETSLFKSKWGKNSKMPVLAPSDAVVWPIRKKFLEFVLTRLSVFIVGISFTMTCLAGDYQPSNLVPPSVNREFRGAWVATVGNISWPSGNNLTPRQQQSELTALLDTAAKLKLNAIVFQVRPACDAIYPSKIEPWSEYLTGKMGKAPQPYYDPLELAIQEAHARGLELHAWFNPYRARHVSAKSAISADHISKRRPDLVKQYGASLWLDPGEKEVQDYSVSVVMDVLRRYDVDGIHFDDYFYPYLEKDGSGQPLEFPDSSSWRRSGFQGKLSREDWRRENVNTFLRRMYREIKTAKPWVKFGVSPFGIWRPGNPPEVRGKDAYSELYADSRKWLANGWLDYCAPQLYWPIDSPGQSFPALLNWWEKQNAKGRHLWPGLNSYNSSRAWPASEIDRQIALTRNQNGSSGHIHWDLRKGIMLNAALAEVLGEKTYAKPALVPVSPWLGHQTPEKPQLLLKGAGGTTASWQAGGGSKPSLWVVQTRTGGNWKTMIVPLSQTSRSWNNRPQAVSVFAVDRVGHASPPTVMELKE
jgi:uncharacterized lipoprotein YddW (UPF0748 family)